VSRLKTPLKAVILVGGEGTRLRPLTNSIPKSMIPVLNRPFLEHTIAYLKKHGVDSIILTLSYLPETIQNYFEDGSNFGIPLTYSMESNPLGTAGAVKNVERHLDGTFIVLNGDIFTDLDLADMIDFHKRKKAKATIALAWVENPCAFGVVETNSDGKVKRFVEKPKPDQVTTNWINAGIYILEPEVLEHVPEGSHYMFEKGLFPLLLKIGEPVYGYHFSGYWLDMGTPEKYLCLNCDLLLAKVKSTLANNLNKDEVFCDKGVIVHPSAEITGPVVIASGCRIGQRVSIKGPVIMAPDCYIGEDARIEGAVLWRGANIGAGVVLKECVIGNNAKIENNNEVISRVVTSHQS
jgi:mannose-1-phosphate guanylyltransferase